MTRYLAFIFLGLTSLTTFATEPVPIDLKNYQGPVKVACVGDSITKGLKSMIGKPYPSHLQALLGDQWQVQNFGVSGRTLLRKGDQPYWKEKAFQQAQDFQPDVVVIMLGTNDTKPKNWVHEDEFYGDYKDLVETFKNLASHPRIFICRPTPVPGAGNYGINETNIQIEIPLIDKLAAEENVDLIDLHAALVDKPQMLPDRVHPNDAGAGVLAATVYRALTGKNPGTP